MAAQRENLCTFCYREPPYKNRPYGNKCSKNLGHKLVKFGRHPSAYGCIPEFCDFLLAENPRFNCVYSGYEDPSMDRSIDAKVCRCPRCNVVAMIRENVIDLRKFSPELFQKDLGARMAQQLRGPNSQYSGLALREILAALMQCEPQDVFTVVISRLPKTKEAKFAITLRAAMKMAVNWQGEPATVWPPAFVDRLISMFTHLDASILTPQREICNRLALAATPALTHAQCAYVLQSLSTLHTQEEIFTQPPSLIQDIFAQQQPPSPIAEIFTQPPSPIPIEYISAAEMI